MKRPSWSFSRACRELVLRYFKKRARSILDSAPIRCEPAAAVEVHTLVCSRHLIQSLWSLKTFLHFAGSPLALSIHDDGSLTPESCKVFLQHFPGCRVIAKRDADDLVKDALKNYEFCSYYRFQSNHPFVAKLFDPMLLSRTKKIILVDSDILFFRKPQEILDCIETETGFFTSDYQNAYALPVKKLEVLFDREVLQRVNAGLIHVPHRDLFDLALLETWLRQLYHHHQKVLRHYASEQTLWALLVSYHRDRFRRLPDSYQISKQPWTAKTVCHHYVNDGSRRKLYTKGIPRLVRSGFPSFEENPRTAASSLEIPEMNPQP